MCQSVNPGNVALPDSYCISYIKVMRTKWVTDPLYLGSYSYGGLDSEFPQNQVRYKLGN